MDILTAEFNASQRPARPVSMIKFVHISKRACAPIYDIMYTVHTYSDLVAVVPQSAVPQTLDRLAREYSLLREAVHRRIRHSLPPVRAKRVQLPVAGAASAPVVVRVELARGEMGEYCAVEVGVMPRRGAECHGMLEEGAPETRIVACERLGGLMQVEDEAPDKDGGEPVRRCERDGGGRGEEGANTAIQVDMGSMSWLTGVSARTHEEEMRAHTSSRRLSTIPMALITSCTLL